MSMMSGPTIDTFSKAPFQGAISVTLIYVTALSIQGMMGGVSLSLIIDSLQNWPAEVGDMIYVVFDQYRSLESYYSSYYNSYYKKAINKNNALYYNNINASSRMFYLSSGSWFDPIRVN